MGDYYGPYMQMGLLFFLCFYTCTWLEVFIMGLTLLL